MNGSVQADLISDVNDAVISHLNHTVLKYLDITKVTFYEHKQHQHMLLWKRVKDYQLVFCLTAEHYHTT